MKVFDVISTFQGAYSTLRKKTDYIVVHHAAALYPTNRGIDDVWAIHRYHLSKGWGGIGYQEVITEEFTGGELAAYLCSNPLSIRANVAYQNERIYGICCATNFELFPGGVPDQRWITALAERIRAALRLFPNAVIVGHREITVKGWESACPGSKWFSWKPKLLAEVFKDQLEVMAAPRMTRNAWDKVLRDNNSPALGVDYGIPVRYGIDPAVALAFFAHESTYGKEGICKKYDTKNWGNVRTAHKKELASGSTDAGGRGPFATYATWNAGLEDWCLRIKEAYVGQRKLATVEAITPVYAPSSDGNRPATYADAVRKLVAGYSAIEEVLVISGIAVDPAFIQAFKDSGGEWKARGVLTPGKPIAEAFLYEGLLYQEFERCWIRRNADGSVDWMLHNEIEEFKRLRLEKMQLL